MALLTTLLALANLTAGPLQAGDTPRPSAPAAYDIAPRLAALAPTVSKFGEFDCLDFQFAGRAAKVVKPAVAVAGRPWAWRTEFWGHEPQTDLSLLAAGFHVVWIDVFGLMGGPSAMAIYDQFYDLLQGAGLAQKAALIGMSRGGLYAYNWAVHRPAAVSCIYADNPVLNLRSWPGAVGDSTSPGSAADWALVLEHYGLTQAEAEAYAGNPIDNLAPLAAAGIALLHVVGDADSVVPVAENSNLVEARYPALGGRIEVIHKPGLDHHPHSLPDPSPIVRFILAETPGYLD